MVIVDQAIGAAIWASYLINGDASGLDEREISLADAWHARLAPAYVVDVERDEHGDGYEPWFTWSYGLHTGDDCSGGDCLTYVTHCQEPDST